MAVVDDDNDVETWLLLLMMIIIRAFVRRTMSASELNLRRRQSLGGEDG